MSEMDAAGFGGDSFGGDGGFNDAGIDAGGFSGDGGGFAGGGFQDAGFGGFSLDAAMEAGLVGKELGAQFGPVIGTTVGLAGYGWASLNTVAGALFGPPTGYALAFAADTTGQAIGAGVNVSADDGNYGAALNWSP